MALEKDGLAGPPLPSLRVMSPLPSAGCSHITAFRAGTRQSPHWLAYLSVQLGLFQEFLCPRQALPLRGCIGLRPGTAR